LIVSLIFAFITQHPAFVNIKLPLNHKRQDLRKGKPCLENQ
jgi:hypothetical protein